jgi:hypothetical protein
MPRICSSAFLLSCVGVTLPKEVYIQNHRLGFLLLAARGAALAFCIYVIKNAKTVGWLRGQLPIGNVIMWAEAGNYTTQSEADFAQTFCDPVLNERFNYWYDDTWTYTNMSCRSLSAGERSQKSNGEIFIPTYFSEAFDVTRAVPPVGHNSCTDACNSLGVCTNTVRGDVPNKTFEFTGARNDFEECLCQCSSSHHRFTTGVEALQVVIETTAQVLENPSLNKYRKYLPKRDSNVLTIIRQVSGDQPVEIKRFRAGQIPKMSVGEWLQIGGVSSLNELNNDTLTNQKKDAKYLPHPALRITGAEVTVAVNYHNGLDPAHVTEDHQGPVCYIEISIGTLWTCKPVVDWGTVEDSRGNGDHRYRYYCGVRFKHESKGHFSYWNPIGIFTMIASALVYLNVPVWVMLYFSRYCLGTLSSIYYKAQVEVLESGQMFYGFLCRALVGKACYDMFLANQNKIGEKECSTEVRVDTELTELLEGETCLERREIDRIRSVLSQGLSADTEGFVTRRAFVEACTNSEQCTLKELVALFDTDVSPNPCMTLLDPNKGNRNRLARGSSSLSGGITSGHVSPLPSPKKMVVGQSNLVV